MKKILWSSGLLLTFFVCLFLTSCPEDNASLSGSQWLLATIDDVAVEDVEQIEFTSSHVNFYDNYGSCWDYNSESYKIKGDSLIMSGGLYAVGYDLDGNNLHIYTDGSEWLYTKDHFDASEYDLCDAVKRSIHWD